MKLSTSTGSLFIIDGPIVIGTALIARGGKLPSKLDALLKKAVGDLGHREVSNVLPTLEGHVLVVGAALVCMPGNITQLRSALRQAGLDTPELSAALKTAYGEWPGAKGYEVRKNRHSTRPRTARR